VWAATPEEWHAALLRLCGDAALRRRMGEAARARAADYDLAAFGERYASYLRELLADQIPPSGRNAMS